MTETEQWVNQTCERIIASGHVRLYRDLYKDLRQTLPCAEACRLIAEGLHATRFHYLPEGGPGRWRTAGDRAIAIAALWRLSRLGRHRGMAECPRCSWPAAPAPDLLGWCRGCREEGEGDGI